MGLFGRKKKEIITISAEQLCTLLEKAIELTEEDVNAHCLTFGPEIMMDYKGKEHYAGVHYDKKRAKAEERTTFARELATVYLDKAEYASPKELYENAILDGEKFSDISDGIVVDPDFLDLL